MPVGEDFRGLCLDCRYPLRALAECRCPECARAFAVDDAASFAGPDGTDGKRVTDYLRFARILRSAVPAAFLLSFGAEMLSKPNSIVFALAVLAWGLSLVYWLGACVRYQQIRGFRRAIPGELPRRPLAALPLMLLAAAALCNTSGPSQVGFWLSRPFMDAMADKVAADPGADFTSGQVGLYWAEGLCSYSRGVVSFYSKLSGDPQVFFRRFPPNHPGPDGEDSQYGIRTKECRYMGGGWYRYVFELY